MNYYNLSDLICRIKVAYRAHLSSIKVLKNKLAIKFLYLIYKIGLIRGFFILENQSNIIVFLKYKNNKPSIFDINIVSKPSKRIYWTLNILSYYYRKHSISHFYIISTNKGLITSNDAILSNNISGEILCKIKI